MRVATPFFLSLLMSALSIFGQGLVPQPISKATIFDDGNAHVEFLTLADPALLDRALSFCPTDRVPCTEKELAWLQVRISIDAYTARRVDPHDSVQHILLQTRIDIKPLVRALREYFKIRELESDVKRVSFVQGLVKSIVYKEDESTGWADYPKFGLEFLVDEQGDCDDAAILNSLILEQLGYSTYFVHWTGRVGHLSTAIEPTRGDLGAVSLPDRSSWVEFPGLPRLLHVDATGSREGCGRANISCGRLGYNEPAASGLDLKLVIRSDAPDLEAHLPLSAWNNGGRDRPSRTLPDRRNLSSEEVHDQLFDLQERERRLRQRLQQQLETDEGKIASYLKRSRVRPEIYATLVISSLAILLSLALSSWKQRRARLRRARELQDRRDAGAF